MKRTEHEVVDTETWENGEPDDVDEVNIAIRRCPVGLHDDDSVGSSLFSSNTSNTYSANDDGSPKGKNCL